MIYCTTVVCENKEIVRGQKRGIYTNSVNAIRLIRRHK
jgi:hypothetical protein